MKTRVYSMSGIQTYKRCEKKFYFQYVRLLDGIRENQAMKDGTSFHKIMESFAKTGKFPDDADYNMGLVAEMYLEHNSFPEIVVSAEEPIYVEVLTDLFIRCTMDLVYHRNGNVVIRDYKTFDRSPTRDIDLDFQARLYLTLASLYYKTTDIVFEHEYVRRMPPGVPKDKAGNSWAPNECYFNDTLVMSDQEMKSMLEELRWDLEQLGESEQWNAWSRTHMKGGGYDDCTKCSVKELCKADLVNPGLIDIDLTDVAITREPVALPETRTQKG